MEQNPAWEANRFSVKKFPAFYGTRRFITAFTSGRHLSLFWTRSSQAKPAPLPNPISWRSILLLSSHLCLGLPSGFFLSGFPTKSLYAPFLSPQPSLSSLFDHLNNWWGIQIIKLLIMWFPPFPCYLIPLRTKYSPLHPILKLPQSMFLPQYEWPSFTPIQNNKQNYCSICLNLYIFR